MKKVHARRILATAGSPDRITALIVNDGQNN